MACIKLDILDEQYRKSELKESSLKKELTFNFCDKTAGRLLVHGNHLSSTQLITDISGGVTQAVMYAPFGQVISQYNQYWNQEKIPDYLFNAKEFDEESGMYYWAARYQDPNMGIFISPDPLFEKKPWMSKYAYCSNNPISRIDPDGLFDTEAEAEKSQAKAIKRYGEGRVGTIKQSESGQFYYNVSEKAKVTVNNDGGERSLNNDNVLNSLEVTAGKERGVYSNKGLRHLVNNDKKNGELPLGTFDKIGRAMKEWDDNFPEKAAPIAQGLLLFNPLLGVANDIMTLAAGEDIYGNEATTADKAWSVAGLLTFGASKVPRNAFRAVHNIGKAAGIGLNSRTAISTGYKESRKKR